MSVKIQTHRFCDERGGGIALTALMDDKGFHIGLGDAVLREAIGKISDEIARQFIEQHGVEIMAKLSPDAIANLTVAAAGAKINETLNKKMPDKILEVERTVHHREVWQRGLLGGMTRLT